MSNLKEISGFYGSGNTPCTVLVYTPWAGSSWYCVEGSKNVNLTSEYLENGVNVEGIEDYDTYTSSEGIETLDQLESFIDKDEEPEEEEEQARFCDFTITINDFDNQAMVDDYNGEVIRMLEGIIKNIKDYGLLNCDGMNLRDINGNTVGNVDVTEN